jgi:hypothetical protein
MTRHFLRLLASALMLTLLILVSAQAQTSQASETAAPSPPPTTTKWSPHSKPFDLVWDVNNEDYNLLPRNPQWAHQLENSGQAPDFTKQCGKALFNNTGNPCGWLGEVCISGSGGNAIDKDTLARDCTSQPTLLDVDTSSLVGDWFWASFLGDPAYCTGIIDGHLTWMVSTYTGRMAWEGWSGDGTEGDGDYNLLLAPSAYAPKNNAGFTTGNSVSHVQLPPLGQTGAIGEDGMGLEFKDTETVNKAGGPWWQQLQNGAQNGGQPTPETMFTEGYIGGAGSLQGVVTGVIGIDGVHGAYTEVHPVFALALNTSSTTCGENCIQETWVYFVRNYGNGGECSEHYYHWPSQWPNNRYFVELPSPKAAASYSKALEGNWSVWPNDVKLVGQAQAWSWKPWNEGTNVSVGILGSAETMVEVQFPNDKEDFGMDGQVTVEYRFRGGVYLPPGNGQWYGGSQGSAPRGRRVEPPRKTKKQDEGFSLSDVGSRIADPALRAKFRADAQDAVKPFWIPSPKAVPITVHTGVQFNSHTPGAASRGVGTAAQVSADPIKKQLDEAIKKLMDTYRPQLRATQPVEKKPNAE